MNEKKLHNKYSWFSVQAILHEQQKKVEEKTQAFHVHWRLCVVYEICSRY